MRFWKFFAGFSGFAVTKIKKLSERESIIIKKLSNCLNNLLRLFVYLRHN